MPKKMDRFFEEELSYEEDDREDSDYEDDSSLLDEQVDELFESIIDDFTEKQLEKLYDLLSEHLDK